METEHSNHDCSTLPDLALNPEMTNELIPDSNVKSNTKTILENVCNDFESIDVLSPKKNKFGALKKGVSPDSFPQCSTDGSDVTGVTNDRSADCVYVSNAASSQSDSVKNAVIDGNSLSQQITTAIVVPSLDSQNRTGDVNSVRTEILPLQDPTKVGILSDSFPNDKNLSSSLAELADAEIVQTSENAVSIIISNPRFIQVLNCKGSDLPSDTSDLTLDSNGIVPEKETLNEVIVEESTPVSDYSLYEDNVENDPHTEVANEIIYSETEEIYNSMHTSTPNTLTTKEKIKPYFRSRADLGKMTVTKARRITAKIKSEWARILEEKGLLICPLPGCFQKYRTIANFQTHYKHCCSGMEKDLKHCPYCASLIISSHKAMLHHMNVEHPEKVEEYKTNYPQVEDVHDCFEDNNSRLVEISQKSLKIQKRKFNLAKENRLSPKRRILKNKIKTINQSVIENSKLRECGRFDDIVSKISSVNKIHCADRDEKFAKECRKRKLVLTEHVVTAEKYFEDEKDADVDSPKEEKEIPDDEKVHTKSRLVLNMDRYKRYTQYLTVTRDFGSHRRTYSRPKSSNVLDSSQLSTVDNDSSESDIHQLTSFESSNISLNENDAYTMCFLNDNNDLCSVSPEILNFDPLKSEASILSEMHLDAKAKRDSIVKNTTGERRTYARKNTETALKSNASIGTTKEKVPCYMNTSIVTSPKIEAPQFRKQLSKISSIITYGKIPDSSGRMKSEKLPPVYADFDSLIKNSNNNQNIDSNVNEKAIVRNNKEDGIKHPHTQNNGDFFVTPKRKRGRPRKHFPVCVVGNSQVTHTPVQKIISENLEHTNLKTFEKPQKVVKKSYASLSSTRENNQIIAQASNYQIAMNKISRMHLLQKKRIKMSAKSLCSLKKAIRCSIKQNQKLRAKRAFERKKKVMPNARTGVYVKSILKNAKILETGKKQQKNKYVEPLKDSGYGYFSSLKTGECQDSHLKKIEHGTITHTEKGNSSYSVLCSKEVESSEMAPHTQKAVSMPKHMPIEPIENMAKTENEKSNKNSLSITEGGLNVSFELEAASKIGLIVSSHSPNEKGSEPVVIKRSRGRPRKSDTPKKAREQIPQHAEKSIVVDTRGQVPSPSLLNVRKSQRIKKRKLTDPSCTQDGSDEVLERESSHEEKDRKMSAEREVDEKDGEIKTEHRKRGRPRKHPKIVSDAEKNGVLEPETDVSKILENELKAGAEEASPLPANVIADPLCTVVRRGRGRPRKKTNVDKCFSAHNTSECEASINNESVKEQKNIDIEPVRVFEEKGIDVEKNILESSSSPPSDKKKLILPLKKRKKVEVEKVVSFSKSSICDISVEKEFSKNVMNKKVGTPFRLRNLHSEVMVDEDLDVGMKERERVMRKNAYAERDVYPTLKPDINEYKVLSNEDAFNQYLQASISVKIENCEWIKLNCFDSVSFDDSKSSMFFTGGPVQSSAFCPIPSHADQYIAVATSAILNNIDRHFSLSYVDTKSEKGLIQFWNLGCLQSTRLNQLPCMEFSLEHQNGFITAMKWCPKGLSLSEDGIAGSRLGLLALSCSDSYVRIYSVPHPNILQNKTAENASIYPAKPCLILNPLFSEPSSLTRKAIATCLDWHQNTEVVAAGYGNGCICVWMVKMISSPSTTIISMKKEDEYLSILPYLVFDASGTPITSVSFAPLDICQYLVCSSFDKTLKFFDLHDTSVPFCSIKRGFALNDCAWAKGFCGSMISLHDGITFKGSSFSKECGTEEFPAQNISGSVGSLTCSAISDVANMQALADINGTVSVNFFHHPCDLMKLPVFDTYVLFETEIVTIESNKAGVDFEKEREVSLAVSDILDIVEVVNDEFSQYCEKISPDNPSEMKLPNIIYTKESTRLCYEPELMDLMSALLESVIENNALKDSAVEDTPVEICLENKLDGTNENKAISSISPIVLTNDDLKEKRYFPMEEMLNNSHTKQKKQLQIENDDNDKKNMKISDQPTLSKETICIDDSMSGNSVKDAPDAVLTNNVPEISSEEMSARSSSSAEFVNQHERNGANEILAQLSGGDAILQLTAESERVAITLQSVDPKHKTVSQQNIELECDVVPQKADEPDCDVVPQKIDEPDSLDCDVIVQQTAESDCHDVLQMKSDTDSSDTSNHGEESNFSDDSSLSMISECSYASNSCDSMQSFLSDSLVPDTPSESPIPTINKEEFLSPVSSSSIENKIVNSELRSIQEENCCSQQAEKEFESKPEINSKNSEEFGHNEIPGTTATQGTEKELENFTKNDEPNLIHMHINAADLPQTFDSDKQSSCLFEEEQKGNNVVTEHLSTEADSMQTVNEASSSTNAASTTDNTRMLESYSVEELASPDLSNEPQCSQTSEQILSNSSEETLGACNSDERINGHLLEERESPVSYASLIASCGLVFKDVNTSSTSSDEKKDHLPVENNVLSSVNAISWNPNIGCHSWLVTAGNSGIARLVCVSELGPQEENSLLE